MLDKLKSDGSYCTMEQRGEENTEQDWVEQQ